jgi:hypothetical protein
VAGCVPDDLVIPLFEFCIELSHSYCTDSALRAIAHIAAILGNQFGDFVEQSMFAIQKHLIDSDHSIQASLSAFRLIMVSCNVIEYLTELLPICFRILSDGNVMLETQIVAFRIVKSTVLLCRSYAQSFLSQITGIVISAYSAFGSFIALDEEIASSLLITVLECMEATAIQFDIEVFWGLFGSAFPSVVTAFSTIEMDEKQVACVVAANRSVHSPAVRYTSILLSIVLPHDTGCKESPRPPMQGGASSRRRCSELPQK